VFLNGLAEMPIEDITFHDIQFDAQTGITIKEAKNIELHHVRVTTKEGPALIAEKVQDLEIDAVKTLRPLPGVPLLALNNVQRLFVHGCAPLQGTGIFLELKGKETKEVTLKNNHLKFVQTPFTKANEIAETINIE